MENLIPEHRVVWNWNQNYTKQYRLNGIIFLAGSLKFEVWSLNNEKTLGQELAWKGCFTPAPDPMFSLEHIGCPFHSKSRHVLNHHPLVAVESLRKNLRVQTQILLNWVVNSPCVEWLKKNILFNICMISLLFTQLLIKLLK